MSGRTWRVVLTPWRALAASFALAALVGIAVVGGPAWAFWSDSSSGSQTVKAGAVTITPVAQSDQNGQALNNNDNLAIKWQRPVVPAGVTVTGYRVVLTITQDTSSALVPGDWVPTTTTCNQSASSTLGAVYLTSSTYTQTGYPTAFPSQSGPAPSWNSNRSTTYNLPATQTSVAWGICVSALLGRTFQGSVTVQALTNVGWSSPVYTTTWQIQYTFLLSVLTATPSFLS